MINQANTAGNALYAQTEFHCEQERQQLCNKFQKEWETRHHNDEEEFRRLILTIYSRASTRIIAHKLVSILLAPLLAVSLVNFLKGKPYLQEIADAVLPENTPERVVKIVTTESVWITVFTVLFVQQLGKVVLGLVDLLNWGHHEKYYDNIHTLIDNDE